MARSKQVATGHEDAHIRKLTGFKTPSHKKIKPPMVLVPSAAAKVVAKPKVARPAPPPDPDSEIVIMAPRPAPAPDTETTAQSVKHVPVSRKQREINALLKFANSSHSEADGKGDLVVAAGMLRTARLWAYRAIDYRSSRYLHIRGMPVLRSLFNGVAHAVVEKVARVVVALRAESFQKVAKHNAEFPTVQQSLVITRSDMLNALTFFPELQVTSIREQHPHR